MLQIPAGGRPEALEEGRPGEGPGKEKSDRGLSRYFELCEEASQGKAESGEA